MIGMAPEGTTDLENEDSWDWDHAEERPPVRAVRAIVSVGFERRDFERVSDYARSTGMKVSEFIREAALAQLPETNRQIEFIFSRESNALTAARGLTVVPDQADLDHTAVA